MGDLMKKVFKAVLITSFVFYLLALISLLFLGSRTIYVWDDVSFIEYIQFSSNLVPFQTISIYFNALFDGSMNIDIPIKNLFGNLLMFLPMGIYLPYFLRKLNKLGTFTISIVILLLSIEVIQLVTRLGSFDIDDLILNMVGALIGFGIWKTKIVQQLLT